MQLWNKYKQSGGRDLLSRSLQGPQRYQRSQRQPSVRQLGAVVSLSEHPLPSPPLTSSGSINCHRLFGGAPSVSEKSLTSGLIPPRVLVPRGQVSALLAVGSDAKFNSFHLGLAGCLTRQLSSLTPSWSWAPNIRWKGDWIFDCEVVSGGGEGWSWCIKFRICGLWLSEIGPSSHSGEKTQGCFD